MSKSKIEWTTKTFNPVTGCEKVSAGCKNCYALTMSNRQIAMGTEKYFGTVANGEWTGEIRHHWDELKRIPKKGNIFIGSMSDIFHPLVPDKFLVQLLDPLRDNKDATYQILTKRPKRALQFCNDVLSFEAPNIWLGTSVEDQKTADERIPILLQTPAAVRFVSAEPLLGPVSICDAFVPCPDCAGAGYKTIPNIAGDGRLMKYACESCGGHEDGAGTGLHSALDWVIVGGESGHGARPMHPQWVRDIRDQCVAAGVAFFFKQWGAFHYADIVEDSEFSGGFAFNDPYGGRASAYVRNKATRPFQSGMYRRLREGDETNHGIMVSDDIYAIRAKKKSDSGRILDGRTWDEMPVLSSSGSGGG